MGKPASRRRAYASGGVPRTVLHISQSDALGGSGRSAYRLHSTLRKHGTTSRMLVGQRRTTDPDVRPLKRNIAWRAGDRIAGTIADSFDLQYVFYPSSFGVASDPWFRDADVVQLYNTHGSYFSHTALPFLSRLRPVVWRLSDMWAFTGHVAYSYDCERWRHGCGSCPYLGEYPALSRDTTAALWRWKNAVYKRSKLTIVAPSRWIERLASREPAALALSDRAHPERHRPRALPSACPREEARARLGLPQEGPVVLFSAPDVSDRRKGGALLNDALERLNGLPFRLLVAGANETPPFPRSFWSLTHLVDEARDRALVRRGRRVRAADARGEPAERGARVRRVGHAVRLVRRRRRAGRRAAHGDRLPREARRRRRARGGDPDAARRRRSCATGWARPAARSPRPSSAPSSRRSASPTCTTTSPRLMCGIAGVVGRAGRRAARASRRVAPTPRARRRRRRDRRRRRARRAAARDPRPRDRRAADDLAERALDDRLQRRDLQRAGAAGAARARRARLRDRPLRHRGRARALGRARRARGCAS